MHTHTHIDTCHILSQPPSVLSSLFPKYIAPFAALMCLLAFLDLPSCGLPVIHSSSHSPQCDKSLYGMHRIIDSTKQDIEAVEAHRSWLIVDTCSLLGSY